MSFESLLSRASSSPGAAKLEKYYEGEVRLEALGVSLPPEVRVLEMIAPFPKMAVDILVEVMKPAGFILGNDQVIPDLLRKWWAANNLDTTTSLAIAEALVQGNSYWIVGHGTDRTPRITAHPRQGMATSFDHLGRVSEALRLYDVDGTSYAAHYTAGWVTYYKKKHSSVSEWEQVDEQATGCARPTVVPMFNRSRLKDTRGRSELLEVLTITDAASRTLTNLQVAQELVSLPQRYLFGEGLDKLLGGGAEGPRSKHEAASRRFSAYISSLWVGPEGAEAGQLPGADLQQILSTFKLYSQIISAITGIPPSMLGISTDNPSSAEAMRVAKDRLISRAEDKASQFGDALEDVAKLALEMYDALPEGGADQLELRWRDPATASESARTASLLQAHAQGVVGADTAREGLRLSPEQLARERSLSDTLRISTTQMGA